MALTATLENTGTTLVTAPARPLNWRDRLTGSTGLSFAIAALAVMAVVSMFVGVTDVALSDVLRGDSAAWELLQVSRIPRTAAVMLAGAAMAVAGLIMQLMVRNKFVEPSTVGTIESATLGVLVVTLAFPAAALMAKMGVAALFALGGTVLFIAITRTIPVRSTFLIPLVGLMLGGVISALTTFVAYRVDLLQTLNTWMIGDFSGVLAGRYELLWVVALLVAVAFVAADRFTVAGMGADFTTNLGLSYRKTMVLGMSLVAMIAAVVVVTVGALPFLGLIVPNLVSLLVGDNARKAVPWTAVIGVGLILVCDIIGRTIIYPYEVPVGIVVSVLGAAVFLGMLIRLFRKNRA
ncbi:ABC transporter permease [Micrococcoides hystricis]|uniref:ABC transporter permease n=1 Tax=Micrococcoides hystricis TaxID=1572761 RepID=A0ABV6P9X7_9MICC